MDEENMTGESAPEGSELAETTPSDNTSKETTTHEKNVGQKSLHRSSTKKIFGGVCGGIAERFDIDANIVRVVFAVLAIVYGLGIAIYLAMWALIPRSPAAEDGAAAEELSPERVRWLRYAIPAGIVLLAVIFLVSLRAGHRYGGGVSLDGLRFDTGLVWLWLFFLIALAVVALRSPSRRFSIRRFFALGFLGVLSFIILAVGVFLIAIQVIGVPLEGGSGVKLWSPTTMAQLQHQYHGAIGESTIDLVNVPFTAGAYSITATQGVGLLVVDIPANVIVDLRTHVGIGDVQSWVVVRPNAPLSAAAARETHVVLDLQVGIGQINLRHFVRG